MPRLEELVTVHEDAMATGQNLPATFSAQIIPMSALQVSPPQPHTPRGSCVTQSPPTNEVENSQQAHDMFSPRSPPHADDHSLQSHQPIIPKRRIFSFASPVLEKYNPGLTLQNSGSVARDHLASERTFLAYVRTSLTITSMGVALVQLFTIAATSQENIEKYSRPLGGIIIILGLITLAIGVFRYFVIQRALVEGNFPAARISPLLLSLALLAIIVVLFGILLAVRD
ncbi:unnamed protein product [Somion occarium]|uniref:DUF202 domain-containing protein n=1 Tax=Somion occarium TaxID=3059160 RepID=A0ABP1E0G6_9APHY